jgi:adenylate kinase
MLIDEVNKHPDTNGILLISTNNCSSEALDAFLVSIILCCSAIALEADEILQRLLERGKTSGRIDDQDEEKIRNRYQEYNEKNGAFNGLLNRISILL